MTNNVFKFWQQNNIFLFVLSLSCGLACLVLYFKKSVQVLPKVNISNIQEPQEQGPLYCYEIDEDVLEDITEADILKGKSIFFHETSCRSHENGRIVLSAREACAVESAARYNPNYEVNLLFTSPGLVKNNEEENDKIISALLEYKNVRFFNLNFEKYTSNTPLEKLYKSGKIESSKYAISHASDVLRYLTMWKYGGIYLDLDVIVKKSLDDIPQNYAGFQEPNYVGSSVLSFTPDGVGNILSRSCLNHLEENFNGNVWGANGPDVITDLVKNICTKENGVIDAGCPYFKVYEPKMFYPIPYPKWKYYFEETYLNETLKLTEESYILHVWNKLSSQKKLNYSSQSVLRKMKFSKHKKYKLQQLLQFDLEKRKSYYILQDC